jgi:hypothetical protein
LFEKIAQRDAFQCGERLEVCQGIAGDRFARGGGDDLISS